MDVDWSDLRLILSVHRTGGAAAAAETLGVSHATVSRRVSDVEKRMKISLVDRSGQSWRTTPLCAAIAEQAASMEMHHHEVMRLVNAFSSETSGQVKISVPTGTIASFCAEALSSLPIQEPEISIVFVTEDKLADLPGRTADLAVRFTPSPDQNLVGESVAESHWGLYCNGTVATEIRSARGKGRLPRVPILTSDPNGGIPDWAEDRFDWTCVCHYAYGFAEKAALAEQGFGVTFIPKVVASDWSGLLQLEGVVPEFKNDLWVLANNDTRSSRRISIVRRHLIKGLRNLSERFA